MNPYRGKGFVADNDDGLSPSQHLSVHSLLFIPCSRLTPDPIGPSVDMRGMRSWDGVGDGGGDDETH